VAYPGLIPAVAADRIFGDEAEKPVSGHFSVTDGGI
jgi:hypothetical protein